MRLLVRTLTQHIKLMVRLRDRLGQKLKIFVVSINIVTALAIVFALYAADSFLEVQLPLIFAGLVLLGQAGYQLSAANTQTVNQNHPGWHIDPDAFEEGIIITCQENKVAHINIAAKRLLNELDKDFAMQDISQTFELLHSLIVDRQGADQVLEAILSTPTLQFSERLRFKDGKTIERATRPAGDNGERIWILRDISHLEQASEDRHIHEMMVEEDAARTAEMAEQLYLAKSELEENQAELTRLANTDMMTNVPNRRHFMNVANEAFTSIKAPFEVWVLMLDIDFFKRVNDTHGHSAGDSAIISFAGIIQDTIGSHGTMGRMGGEEFAVILPGVMQSEAEAFAETIRTSTENNQVDHEGQMIAFTCSIGIAKAEVGDKTIEAALDRSDSALYEAKQSGRNQSKLYVNEIRLQA